MALIAPPDGVVLPAWVILHTRPPHLVSDREITCHHCGDATAYESAKMIDESALLADFGRRHSHPTSEDG